MHWVIDVDRDDKTACTGETATSKSPLRFQVMDVNLPAAAAARCPAERAKGRRGSGGGLAPGTFWKSTASLAARVIADEWAAGVALVQGPEFDQAEELRAAIVERIGCISTAGGRKTKPTVWLRKH